MSHSLKSCFTQPNLAERSIKSPDHLMITHHLSLCTYNLYVVQYT